MKGANMLVIFPIIHAIDKSYSGNRIRQVAKRCLPIDGTLATFKRGRLHGLLFRPAVQTDEVIIVPHEKFISIEDQRVVCIAGATRDTSDLRDGTWIRHPLLKSGKVHYESEIQDVIESWTDAFSYIEEDKTLGVKGLRKPQIGAVHAVHAHWSASDAPATIVMPTGTGKTEVMLSVLVSARCSKLLVVVPTDALREQLAEKFLSLGVLKETDCRVLAESARYPIVGMLQHVPRTVVEVDDAFDRCQVIVTTSSIAGRCEQVVQDRMAYHCPYLFIDEAHHTEAPTWKAFKDRFRNRRILQFTATPFREDGKPLDGEIIYKYSLRRAQEEEYFKPIHFLPVVEFNPSKSDAAVAKKAVEQLRADTSKRHILMARVDGVERAKTIYKLYSGYTEFKPVQLHTGIHSSREREAVRNQIISGESRIIVCVDMLGEGFDLPELKIAAFHDIRKTLAVTLQLAGRFTRARPDLGDAIFIANTADVDVKSELRKLYAQDPDWNTLLPDLSDQLIGEQVSLKNFLRGFTEFPEEIPLKNVRPAKSAIVYKTRCGRWAPEDFKDGIPGIASCEQVHHALNTTKNTLVVVTAKRMALSWIDSANLFQWEWELYVLVWLAELKLLFINCSANAGEYRSLAKVVAGDDVELIKGQEVFRTFAGVNRLKLQNVGLTEQLGRNVRYTGRMGTDVESGMTEVQKRRARKAVLAGSGFEGGKSITVGASRKGRIWAHHRGNIIDLVAWCENTGKKLLDERIDPEEVLKGTLVARTIPVRPVAMPIAIDWPEEMYKSPEVAWSVQFCDLNWALSELSIELVDPDSTGPLRFAVVSESYRVEFDLELYEENEIPNYRFTSLKADHIQIRRGENAAPDDIVDFFYYNPPVIWFTDGSSLEGDEHVELKVKQPPYDLSKIDVWDWTDTNIRKESQGKEKDATSIQARVIRELKMRDYAVILDDDGKGEIADVVAVRLVGDPKEPAAIETELYHCKYSISATSGQRVNDLYEVCGQAQKCISWMASTERQTDIFTHLLRRNARRIDDAEPSRLELGDSEQLLTIREMSRHRPVKVKVYVVQPGLSKKNATRDQLELLSVTENHLMETYQLPFGVIASV
jgi:superfamily II DNA or RNA helicase